MDLLGSPSGPKFLATLRSEAAANFKGEADWLDSRSLTGLVHTDSTIRESLRMNPVLSRTLREVVSKYGLDLPNGHHIPQGTWIGVPAVSMQRDENLYPNPDTFEAFRFVERISSSGDGILIPAVAKTRKLQGLSTTSDKYLAFGHGRHAWYVTTQMRTI